MSGFLENRASETPRQSDSKERILTISTARKMLPLVERIVTDILNEQNAIDEIQPRLAQLDRQRHDLVWLERQQRYELRDEVCKREQRLEDSREELRQLGVVMINPDIGRIGFPTLVNNRMAFFAWWPGEETVKRWHFATELRCRSIPNSWVEEDQVTLGSKS